MVLNVVFHRLPRCYTIFGSVNDLCKGPGGWNTVGELEANRNGVEGARESSQKGDGRAGRQASQLLGSVCAGSSSSLGPQGAAWATQLTMVLSSQVLRP